MLSSKLGHVTVAALLLGFAASLPAQENTEADATPPPAAKSKESAQKVTPLDIGQQVLLNRFDRFEQEMIQMHRQMKNADPDRADLLYRAYAQSQREAIIRQMRTIATGLSRDDKAFGDLLQRQESLVSSLRKVLELLQSENRVGEIEAERKRISEILKNVNRLIGDEKDARAEAERGTDIEKAAGKQDDVSKKAKDLVEKVTQQDKDKEAKDESDSGEKTQPKDGESKDGQPKDGEPKDGEPKDGEPKDGDPKDGQAQEGEEQQQQTPGRQDLEEARKEMERAIEELRDKQDRGKASRHQDEAIKRLLEAKQKLEEILRQLREEEKSLTLASLESRFRKMLSAQLLIYQETVQLGDKTNEPNLEPRSRQLGRREEEIVREIEKALVLLREEGSSVAFPEAVEALRDEMVSIVKLLDRAKVGELTQTTEQSVIEGLEEMIDALQKEIEKQEEEQQQQQQQQQGQPGEQPLVDTLSELKMLRSLQLRINRRTRQLGRMIEGDQADDPDLRDQLQSLSRREAKIQKATYDLSTGKNR